jgi:hypothetical protein
LEDRLPEASSAPLGHPLSSTIKAASRKGAAFSTSKSSELGKARTARPRPDIGLCDTSLNHHGADESGASHGSARDSGSRSCSTRLDHQGASPAWADMATKPSGNGPAQPSLKRSARTPRSRTCGLMVRGEVYYLRLKVPQHLQSQIGHSPPEAGCGSV